MTFKNGDRVRIIGRSCDRGIDFCCAIGDIGIVTEKNYKTQDIYVEFCDQYDHHYGCSGYTEGDVELLKESIL